MSNRSLFPSIEPLPNHPPRTHTHTHTHTYVHTHSQLACLRELMKDVELGERHMLLIGNQGMDGPKLIASSRGKQTSCMPTLEKVWQ